MTVRPTPSRPERLSGVPHPPTRVMRENPDIDQLRRQARELLEAYRAQSPDAVLEVEACHRTATPDTVALHDAQFAHHGFDAAVELARKPDAIWMPHYFYVGVWHDLLTEPALWSDYDVWPDALIFGFALRRGSPHHAELARGFEEIWRRLYPGEDMSAWRARRLRSELPECRRESRIGAAGPEKPAP